MVKGMDMLGVNVRKMKPLTMQMETVTLIGNGKYNLTCFPWQTCFFVGVILDQSHLAFG